MSIITLRLAAGMDEALKDVTHVAWSEDGLAQSANILPSELTGVPPLNPATNANPSVVGNNGEVRSNNTAVECTITHWAFATNDTPALVTTWNLLASPAILEIGGMIKIVDGALSERVHQTESAP
jgi:hypothetical protein